MSIQHIFKANDYHLFCDTLTCNNLNAGSKAIYRLNVDPTSNPDPSTGGLIVTAASTAGFNFPIPLSGNQSGLSIGSPFIDDPDNHLSFSGSTITCNKAGKYRMSIQLGILSNLVTPDNILISQIVPIAQNIFAGPPGLSVGASFISMISTPIVEIFNLGAIIASEAIIELNQGDQIDVKFYLAYDSCVISLTSCLCINEL